MPISAYTELSKPEGDNKISAGTLAYVNARAQARAYSLVIKELKKSGMTQAQLAKRLGRAPEVISRMLNRPRNWEVNTFSELLFAICGALPSFSISQPLERSEDNATHFYKVSADSAATTTSMSGLNEAPNVEISNIQVRQNGTKLRAIKAVGAL